MISNQKRLPLAKIGKAWPTAWLSFATAFAGLLLVMTTSSAIAATNVTSTVDRNALNPEDTLTLTLSIESEEEVSIGQPAAPNFPDFDVLNSWTSQSQQATMVSTPQGPQFKKTFALHYNYMLLPKRQGNLMIGAITIKIDGRDFSTKPIPIKVAKGAGAAPQARGAQRGRAANPGGGAFPPPDLFDEDEDDLFSQLLRRVQPPAAGSRTLPINANDAFFIQVETDKTEAYAGEQVTVSFYLYTRGLIRDLDTLKYPALRGFWKEDIEIATHLNFQSEVVNGIPYKKALLASFALFPIKEGSATIDPYEAKCSVIAPNDAFGGFGMGKAYTYTKSSQPVKINVKPLPTEGRPADFSGAVGDFQVTSRIEDRNVVEGQPLTLKIRFEGRGNAKLIDLPPFTPPEGIELYDTQNEARFYKTGTSYKEFKVLMIPRREGDFTIPSISVSVFDPDKKVYVEKKTEPVTFHAAKGQSTNKKEDLAMPEDRADDGKKKGPDTEPHLIMEAKASGMHLPAPIQTTGWALIFVGLTGCLIWKARNELGWGQRKKDLMRILSARLARVEARASAGDWRGVGTEMTNTVYFVLGAITGEGGANVELSKLLLKAPPSVRRELAVPLAAQMETFQILTFAPDDVVGNLKNPAELSKAIAEMRALMTKAVSLGLSSEQSGGSESGPKAS